MILFLFQCEVDGVRKEKERLTTDPEEEMTRSVNLSNLFLSDLLFSQGTHGWPASKTLMVAQPLEGVTRLVQENLFLPVVRRGQEKTEDYQPWKQVLAVGFCLLPLDTTGELRSHLSFLG